MRAATNAWQRGVLLGRNGVGKTTLLKSLMRLAYKSGGDLSGGQQQLAIALADDYLVMERGEFIGRGLGKDMQANGVRQMVAI